MAALFNPPKPPKIPKINDTEIEDERRRQAAQRAGGGRGSTILTSGTGITAPILGRAAALGGAL